MTSSIKDDHASRIAIAGNTPRSRAMRQADANRKRLRPFAGKGFASDTLDASLRFARKGIAILHRPTTTAGAFPTPSNPPSSPTKTRQVVSNFPYAIAA